MENYINIISEEHEWNTNWKILTENFMEGYHLPVAHQGTIGPYFNVMDTEFDSKGSYDFFTYQLITLSFQEIRMTYFFLLIII